MFRYNVLRVTLVRGAIVYLYLYKANGEYDK